MTVAPALVADCLVNLFGAIGALMLAAEVLRGDPNGPVTRRISLALAVVGALFLVRSGGWWFASPLAVNAADLLAALTPLASLLVAEGLMRRHAPLWLKVALLSAPVILAFAKALPFSPEGIIGPILIVTVIGGYAAIGFMLLRRERRSLSAAENVIIGHVLLAMAILAPLIVTDFRSLWPDVPVRLGALGALLVLYLGFSPGNQHASLRARLTMLLGFAGVAALFSLGYQAAGAGGDAAQLLRAGAVGFAGLLCAAIASEARGARSERLRPLSPLLQARTPEAFEGALKSHALLSGAQVLCGSALEHVLHPAFQSLLEGKGFLTIAGAPWGRPITDEGVERALSLLAAHDATHLVLLTPVPLRVMVVALPALARDARLEGDIQLARLAGELAYAKAVSS